MRILLNMEPIDLSDIFKQEYEYDLFQPLEVLRG